MIFEQSTQHFQQEFFFLCYPILYQQYRHCYLVKHFFGHVIFDFLPIFTNFESGLTCKKLRFSYFDLFLSQSLSTKMIAKKIKLSSIPCKKFDFPHPFLPSIRLHPGTKSSFISNFS